MSKLYSITLGVALLALSGCMTGQAEYESLSGGQVQSMKLKQAQATCRMHARQAIATGAVTTPDELIADSKDCLFLQGVLIKGFRQKDGTLTKDIYAGSKKL